jgi:hypothetical protein
VQVFLDAIGEDAGSMRRLGNRGIYEHRVLNRGHKGRDIDLVLLDERYERVPLPCHTRRDFCQPSVKKGLSREVRWFSFPAILGTMSFLFHVFWHEARMKVLDLSNPSRFVSQRLLLVCCIRVYTIDLLSNHS